MEDFKLTKSIKHILTTLEKCINHRLKEKDLSMSQGVILVKISESEKGERSLKALEKEFSVAQSTIFGVIARLEKKGLVTTYLHDNKTKVARVTDEGRALTQFIMSSIHDVESGMFDEFTEIEKMMFIELLKKMEFNLTNC